MSETAERDWSLIRKRFGLFLIGSLLFSGFVVFRVSLMWGADIDRLFFAMFVALWGAGALFAARGFTLSELTAAVFGLTWGPLFCLLYIYIVQGHVWIWYPATFVLIPPAVTLTLLPIWYFARRNFERKRNHAA